MCVEGEGRRSGEVGGCEEVRKASWAAAKEGEKGGERKKN
jgi:hypothetical protein